MPPEILGTMKDSNLASAESAFAKYVVEALAELVVQELNVHLLSHWRDPRLTLVTPGARPMPRARPTRS